MLVLMLVLIWQKIKDRKYSVQDNGKGALCFGDPALCRESESNDDVHHHDHHHI